MNQNTVTTRIIALSLLLTIAAGLMMGHVVAVQTAGAQTAGAKQQVEAPEASSPEVEPERGVEIDSFTQVDVETGVVSAETPDELSVGVHLGVLRFVQDFNDAHTTRNLDYLQSSLHPDVAAAFGAETCTAYVEATMGSIQDMVVSDVGNPETYSLPTPDGELTFTNSIPVSAEWTVAHTGEIQQVVFHVIPEANTALWLTTCGWTTNA